MDLNTLDCLLDSPHVSVYGASQADVKAIMQLLAKQLESVELPELDMPDLALHTGGSGGESTRLFHSPTNMPECLFSTAFIW